MKSCNPVYGVLIDLGGVLFYDEDVELFFHYQIFMQTQHYLSHLSPHHFFDLRRNLYCYYKNHWIAVWLEHILPKPVASAVQSIAWETTLRHFNQLFRPYKDVLHFLDQLSLKYPLFCVANQPQESQEVLINLGFNPYFKEILIDTLVGYSKPDVRIFELALKKSGFLPENLIHIGDRLDNDIIPALACGLQTIQLVQAVEYVELLDVPTDFCLQFYKSLKETWHRFDSSQSLDYMTCSSYEEVLQGLRSQEI